MPAKLTYKFKPISFWPNAEHVFVGQERVGIVKANVCTNQRGRVVKIFEAYNSNFLPIEGAFPTREAAVKAIPKPKSRTKSKSLSRGVG